MSSKDQKVKMENTTTSSTCNSKNKIDEKNNNKDDLIEKSTKWFAYANIPILLFSAYFSIKICFSLIIILATIYYYLTSNHGKKNLNKLRVYLNVRPYLKASKTLNHATTLIAKYIVGLPLKEGETEVDTFNEIKDSLGDKWPFMKKVENTRKVKINVEGKDCICISSYNYLDLGRDESIQDAAIEAAKAYSTGNHGPRMLCGNLQICEDLEKRISKFFGKDSALVFSSGYLACMSTVAGIAKKGDLLLMDKFSHASLRAGSRLSSAKTVFFKHNDFKDAEKKIKQNKFNNLYMVIEGLYSMDGDIGDLPAARKLCDKYKGTLIMDEAHSLGTIGKTGHGCEEHFNYEYRADIICGTFTKSVSSVGGFLTCARKIREYYTFYAPGLVFSAPLSAYHCGAAIRAFEIIENHPEKSQRLQENSEYFRKILRDNDFNIGDTVTCVIPVIFRDIIQIIEIHSYLLSKGVFAAAVMAPACPFDAPRFRVCVTAADTRESLDNTLKLLIEAREKNPESEKIKELVSVLM